MDVWEFCLWSALGCLQKSKLCMGWCLRSSIGCEKMPLPSHFPGLMASTCHLCQVLDVHVSSSFSSPPWSWCLQAQIKKWQSWVYGLSPGGNSSQGAVWGCIGQLYSSDEYSWLQNLKAVVKCFCTYCPLRSTLAYWRAASLLFVLAK